QSGQGRGGRCGVGISVGSGVFGAISGKKALSVGTVGRASTAARGAGRVLRESGDGERAGQTLAAAEQALRELDGEIEAAARALESTLDPRTEALARVVLRPKRANVTVRFVTL